MPEHTPAPTPSRAIYGFVMYLSFKLFFSLYLICAIIPEDWFKNIGITCIPQRYWFVTVPIFCLTALGIFAFIIYPSLGLILTPNVNDLRTIADNITGNGGVGNHRIVSINECSCIDVTKCKRIEFEEKYKQFAHKSIPILTDLEIWNVSDFLYLK